MSIVIRDVREHELDSVLALNNNAGLAILPLDAARLRLFYETAEYFRVAERDGNLAGFLIGFGSDSQHDSSNFAWFKQHLTSKFFYIDRIVVASRRRGGGVGRAFYADMFGQFAREVGDLVEHVDDGRVHQGMADTATGTTLARPPLGLPRRRIDAERTLSNRLGPLPRRLDEDRGARHRLRRRRGQFNGRYKRGLRMHWTG